MRWPMSALGQSRTLMNRSTQTESRLAAVFRNSIFLRSRSECGYDQGYPCTLKLLSCSALRWAGRSCPGRTLDPLASTVVFVIMPTGSIEMELNCCFARVEKFHQTELRELLRLRCRTGYAWEVSSEVQTRSWFRIVLMFICKPRSTCLGIGLMSPRACFVSPMSGSA